MIRLELSDEEATMLSDILQSYLGDLGMEIADTERIALRAPMKERKEFLITLLNRLQKPEGTCGATTSGDTRPLL